MESIVPRITRCKFDKNNPFSEDAVMMKTLQVVKQSMSTGNLLQISVRYKGHALIQAENSRFPQDEIKDSEADSESDNKGDAGDNGSLESANGV
ncbi:Pattern formation protein EMB30 [Sesbania bispinosa]|nr:Pattern formation protein EMB30 [Sesbania bispinosa]